MPARTISQLESTSAILGEYMLKGWTLTDLHCDICHSTPLMREPTAIAEREGRERIQFCALCDGRPDGASTSTSSITPVSAPAPASTPAVQSQTYDSPFGPISASSAPQPAQSFNSAPPTENNDSHSIAESISSLLLRGHSLLGENCPNITCKGVPLVGYPRRPDGKKDGRKMCVSCNGRWVDEKYLSTSTSGDGTGSGMTIVPPTTLSDSTGRKHGNEEQEEQLSPRSKARNELYGLTSTGQNQPQSASNKETVKGKERQVNESDRDAFAHQAQQSVNDLTLAKGDDVDMDLDSDQDYQPIIKEENLPKLVPSSPLAAALTQTSNSLANTLRSLSSSLDRYAAHPPSASSEAVSGRWFVDLKLHTEAIKDVLSVVEQVERARRA